MKILYGSGFSEEERQFATGFVGQNVLEAMATLIDKAAQLGQTIAAEAAVQQFRDQVCDCN